MKRHVHLGLGRFHRAHQAFYLEQVGWKITAFSMRSPGEADALRANDHLYQLKVIGGAEPVTRPMKVIDSAYFISRDTEQFFQLMQDPSVKTVSLTITEKGYCANSEGQLDSEHPDLETCALSYLVKGIERRHRLHVEPLNILSCDNLVKNGELLARVCGQWAEKFGHSIDFSRVSFPNTMVDRIVPSGPDPLLVSTEQFHQWVIEDKFLGERPQWEQPGLFFTDSVEAFEAYKLGLLNASHSFMAYYGQICGHEFVHQAVRDEHLRELIEKLYFQEVGPRLKTPHGLTLKDYGKALLARFDNPGLPHKLSQIAMDGSQKVPQRFLPHIKQSSVLKMAYAAWFSYMWLGITKRRDFFLSDPRLEKLKEAACDNFQETVTAWKTLLGWPDYPVELLESPGSSATQSSNSSS